MGEVFRADDLILGQAVALKFLPEYAKSDTNLLTRFYDEVRIARQISHKNVCRVYDIGEIEGQLYLTMEYIDGEDLGSLLRRIGRLPSDKALEFTRKLCAGVAAAHAQGVLHRDLKPANIMIDGVGELRITDFGLAAVAGQVVGSEVRNGTPAYMAPEQLTGREVSVQSDLYALGLVLYEMFTGKQPHHASSVAEMAKIRQESHASSPSTHVHDMEPAVEKAIMHCLEPDPRKRPPSAMALAASLPGGDPLAAALAAGETPSPELVAASGSTDGISPRTAVLTMAAIVTLLIGLSLAIPAFHLVNKVPHELPPEALIVKAREIQHSLGYTDPAGDFDYGLTRDTDFLNYLQSTIKPKDWDAAMASPPSIAAFYYRESALPMISDTSDNFGRNSRSIPAMDRPGMTLMDLDMDARLRYFKAIPPHQEAAGTFTPTNWDALFSAARLDRKTMQPTDPEWAPIVMADERKAWTGTYPSPYNLKVRIEAASYHGKPVFFQVVWPWTKPDKPIVQATRTVLQRLRDNLGIIFNGVILITSLIMARYNWKAGRGDRVGAVRVGICLALMDLASRVLWIRHSPSQGGGRQLVYALQSASALFAMFWLFYLTLEPWVRRLWPRTLISWSRLVGGQIRDAWVGRDLLFGTLIGLLYCGLIETFEYIGVRAGDIAYGDFDASLLLGFGNIAAMLIGHVRDGATNSLVFFLVLFLAKALLKKEWAAGMAFVLILTLGKVPSPPFTLPKVMVVGFWMLLFALIVYTMLRFGAFALMITIFTIDFLTSSYLTTDFGAWYGVSSWFTLAVLLGIATFGANIALGDKPFFSGSQEAS